MKLGTAQIIQGNALNLPLPDNSVDACITSPPYFGLRSYQDGGEHYDGQIGSEATPAEFLDALLAATREMVRVLKPTGSIFVNLGDKYCSVTKTSISRPSEAKVSQGAGGYGTTGWNKTGIKAGPEIAGVPFKSLMGMPWRYALRCIDELGLILRAEIIWAKPNGLPESVTDRVRRSHEQWFHFTKQPRYYSSVDEIREPQVYPNDVGRYSAGSKWMGNTDNTKNWSPAERTINPLGKLPGSVWNIECNVEQNLVKSILRAVAGSDLTPEEGERLWLQLTDYKTDAIQPKGSPSVWSIPTQPLTVPPELGVDHFAAYPMEWPRRIIQGWTPNGVCTGCGEGRRPLASAEYTDAGGRGNEKWDRVEQGSGDYQFGSFKPQEMRLGRANRTTTITGYVCSCPTPTAPTTPAIVLDPFGGTGTTALVAKALGRTGISIDLSADYCRLATWRCNDPRELAAALQVEKPDPVHPDQLDLFSGIE